MATTFPFPNTQKGSTTDTSPTTNSQGQREDLPSEAMAFNGEFFEDKIEGYQTLYVRGRESMLAEINAYETGVRDGTGITSKRFPARELVIGYLLHAKSNEAFREAYNTLNGILYTQDAQIIFNDEVDKYFTGTPEGLDEIESGRNFVQGEILIYCADPFKYSINEAVATIKGSYVSVTYNGTYKAYPRLEADFPSSANGNPDCGYVSWMIYSSLVNDGKAIQLGNASESDLGEFYVSETLVDQTFNASYFDTGKLPDNWSFNYKDLEVNVSSSLWIGTGGRFTCSDALRPSTFTLAREATSSDSRCWTGMNVSCEFPADSNGVVGAKEWKIAWKQTLSVGSGYDGSESRGGIQVIVTNSSDTVIAAANMYRGSNDASKKGRLTVHTKNSKTSKTGIDWSQSNKYWGSGGTCTMTKSGSKVSWNLGGLSFSLTDSDIEDMTATRVTVVFLKDSLWPVGVECLNSLSVQKSDVSDWRNVANTFGANDTAIADCTSGTITLNGREDAGLGVLGNDWETFCFYPGEQNIGFLCSDWCANKPSTKVYYREVFI